jgi:hypothetical protein
MELTATQKKRLASVYGVYQYDVHRGNLEKAVVMLLAADHHDGRGMGVDVRDISRVLFIAGNDPRKQPDEFVAEVEQLGPPADWGDRYWMPKGFVDSADLPFKMLGPIGRRDWMQRHPGYQPTPQDLAPPSSGGGPIGGGTSTEKLDGNAEGGSH